MEVSNLEQLYEEHYSNKKQFTYRIMDLKAWLKECEHTDNGGDEITAQCPYCMEAYKSNPDYNNTPYLKEKLYIKRGFRTGWCFRCGSAYVNKPDEAELLKVPTFLMDYESPEVDLTMADSRWQLSNYINQKDELSFSHKTKLYNRNPYILSFLDILGFKTLNEGSIMIPIHYNEELIYYQLWNHNRDPKYWLPPIKTKPLCTIGPIKSKGVIVEGYFDAVACLTLYPDRTPMYLLGSYLTPVQEIMLRDFVFNDLMIYLDNSKLSYKVYNKLKRVLDFTDLSVRTSDGTDPEEELRLLMNFSK